MKRRHQVRGFYLKESFYFSFSSFVFSVMTLHQAQKTPGLSRHGMGLGFNLNILTKVQQFLPRRQNLVPGGSWQTQHIADRTKPTSFSAALHLLLPLLLPASQTPHTWKGWGRMGRPKSGMFLCKNPSTHGERFCTQGFGCWWCGVPPVLSRKRNRGGSPG